MRFRALSILGLLVWALPGLAGSIPCQTPFNPSVDSDAMAVCAPNGTLYDYLSVTEADEVAGFVYTLSVAAPDPAEWDYPTTFCEFDAPEPCSTRLPSQDYSDIFGVVGNGITFNLAFSSDDECGLVVGNGGYYFVREPMGWYEATMYLAPSLRTAGYSAWFISDSGVPEPSSVVLLLTGVAMLGFLSRRRR